MASFDLAVEKLFELEGGYAPVDTPAAGEVKYGITERFLKLIRYPKKPRDITKEEARQIYRKHFWDPFGWENLENQRMATAMFVQGVNGGPLRSLRYGLLSLREAGIPVSLSYRKIDKPLARLFSLVPVERFIRNFVSLWRRRYNDIVSLNPSYGKYLRNWYARLDQL